MIKLNKRKIINMFIAINIGYIPLVFPEEPIMLTVMIIGLLSIVVIAYCLLDNLTEIIGDKINENKKRSN